MFEIWETLLKEVFGDRDRQRPCSFFGSVGTDIQCDENCEDVEEHNGTEDIQALPTSQEAVVGWWILDGRFFRKTVGKHGDEAMIGKYVKNQGNEYHKLHSNHQIAVGLFIVRAA